MKRIIKGKSLEETQNIALNFIRFFALMPIPVAWLDKGLCYRAYSESWITTYSIPEKDIIGRHHYDLFPEIPKLRPDWVQLHAEVIGGKIPNIVRENDRFVREDGSIQILAYTVYPTRDEDGEIDGMVMLTMDISKDYLHNEVYHVFANIIAHYLNAPVATNKGLTNWLKIDIQQYQEKLVRRAKMFRNLSFWRRLWFTLKFNASKVILDDLIEFRRITYINKEMEAQNSVLEYFLEVGMIILGYLGEGQGRLTKEDLKVIGIEVKPGLDFFENVERIELLDWLNWDRLQVSLRIIKNEKGDIKKALRKINEEIKIAGQGKN